jgi:hypothetical protein
MAQNLVRPEEPSEAVVGPVTVRVGKRKRLSLRGAVNIKAWTHYQALMRRRKKLGGGVA